MSKNKTEQKLSGSNDPKKKLNCFDFNSINSLSKATCKHYEFKPRIQKDEELRSITCLLRQRSLDSRELLISLVVEQGFDSLFRFNRFRRYIKPAASAAKTAMIPRKNPERNTKPTNENITSSGKLEGLQMR